MSYPVSFSDGATPLNSPVHWLLQSEGAVWGKRGGWARPLFFKLEEDEEHAKTLGE